MKPQHIIIVILIILIIYFGNRQLPRLHIANIQDSYKINEYAFNILLKGPVFPLKSGYNYLVEINDPIGYNLYQSLLNKYPAAFWTIVFGRPGWAINDFRLVRYILERSPKEFGPGKFKKNYFANFMKHNVGVSGWPEWIPRRRVNEKSLQFRAKGNDAFKDTLAAIDKVTNELFVTRVSAMTIQPQYFSDVGKYTAFEMVFGAKYNVPANYSLAFDLLQRAQYGYGIGALGVDTVGEDYRARWYNFVHMCLQDPVEGSLLQIGAKHSKLPGFQDSHSPRIQTQTTTPQSDHGALSERVFADQLLHWIFPMHNVLLISIPVYLTLMNTFPEHFEKVKEEIDEGVDVRRQDTFLHYTVQESLRLYGIVTSLLRTAASDMKLEIDETKYKFSKGDQLMISSVYINRNEECFPDNHKYIPERWKDIPEDSQCDIIFNIGPQVCPGSNLTQIMIKKFAYNIIKHYNIRVISPNLDRNNLPDLISPWDIKLQLRSKAGLTINGV